MNVLKRCYLILLLLAVPMTHVWADSYKDSIKVFKDAAQSRKLFENSYGYAVFPTIGKAGLVVGAAGGEGRVYQQGKYVGNTTMGQVSIGLQLGAQGFT